MKVRILERAAGAAVCLAVLVLAGCANQAKRVDPYEKVNRCFYQFNEGLDKVALKPASDLYVKAVPKPVRTGLGNAFDNLGYGNVILNDFLQAKWGQGWSDAGRMAANSTIGLGGIFDPATQMGLLPHENDFGVTLGKWGLPSGPYLVLPLFGPSSLRDTPGIAVGFATDPTTWVNAPLTVMMPLYATEAIDTRSRAEGMVKFRNEAALDPYVFTRNAYLQYREGQIHEGPRPSNESLYDEGTDATTPPATQPAGPTGK